MFSCLLLSCNNKTTIDKPKGSSTNGKIQNLKTGCNFNEANRKEEITIYSPNEKELSELKEIVSYTGIPLNFEIFEADINNAVATIINGERYILYDTNLLDFANNSTHSYWSSISILAHEIGHHLSGHTLNQLSSDSHKSELEADKFSGFVLYKMGASLEQAIQTMQKLGTVQDTESHPNKDKRIRAIKSGWNEAYKKDYKSATPPPLKDNPEGFYEYTMEMLYDEQFLEFYSQDFFTKYDFFYGVVTGAEYDYRDIENVTIEVVKTGKKWKNNVGSFKGKKIKIWVNSGVEMCNACWSSLPELLKPGRRVKFAFNEGHPEGGTMYNGVFNLSYLKAISNEELDFYLRENNNQGRKKIINEFLIAEENRNFYQIQKFYSNNVKRYWNTINPSSLELKKQYENAWSNTKYAQNLVRNIFKVNEESYILHTKFRFYDLKKEKLRNIDSKVFFKFNNENKIVEIYGASN